MGGCDNAGKTTLLYMLKEGRMTTALPTAHAHSEDLVIRNINFKTFDLGGHETARRIWKDYLHGIDAIFFIVDAADRTRFAEAKEELQRLLEDPTLNHVPII